MWPFRKREDRAVWQVGDAWPGPATFSGLSVSPDTALRLSAVWACVRILSDTASTLPYRTFDQDTLRPVAPPSLFVAPAAHTKWHSWIAQIMRSTLLTGDTYGLIAARAGAGMRPSQIELVHPDRISATLAVDRMTTIYRFDGREIIRGEELWRFPGYEYPGVPGGLSPIGYARETVGLGLATQKYGAEFFGSEGRPAGIITTDQHLQETEIDNLQKRWQEMHVGRRRTAIMDGGATYKPIAVPPEEAQFLETQQFTVQQIAMIFGVPPEMIAASVAGQSITYSNTETKPLDLLKFGVGPWLVRLQAELDDLLPGNIVGRFDPAGLLRADLKTRYDAYQVAIDGGWLTLDEVRALEELPPLAASSPPRLEAVS
jgi:HK97 family phage portal protein